MAYQFNINKIHTSSNQSLPNFHLSINLQFDDGEHVAVMGESGCGKSTMMDSIQNQLLAEGIVFRKVFQDENSALVSDLSILDNLTIGAVLGNIGATGTPPKQGWFKRLFHKKSVSTGMSRADAEAEAKYWLTKVGIPERLWQERPSTLSGGQRQRAGIARSLVGGAKLVIMDEPTSGLDKTTKMEVVQSLKSLKDLGVTILLVTHDPDECNAFASRVIRLQAHLNEATNTIESRVVSDTRKDH